VAGRQSSACFCYILECADGSYYTGWTTDPGRRLNAHNAGRGARYTRSRRPVRLVLLEPHDNRSSAMKRERAIKTMTRARKQMLIGLTGAKKTRKRRRLNAPGRSRRP